MIGWTSAEAHASAAALSEVVQPYVDAWRAERETEVLERWREEVGKNALAVPRADTLEAASDGGVEVLLHQAGVQRDEGCASRARGGDRHDLPARRDDEEHRDDGLDLAARLTLAYGATCSR